MLPCTRNRNQSVFTYTRTPVFSWLWNCPWAWSAQNPPSAAMTSPLHTGSLICNVVSFLLPLPDSPLLLCLDQSSLCQLKPFSSFSDDPSPHLLIPYLVTSPLKFRFRKAAGQCENERFVPLNFHVNRG